MYLKLDRKQEDAKLTSAENKIVNSSQRVTEKYGWLKVNSGTK